MWRTKASVRLPSFFGPFALAAGLLTVICFSEPFWQNFYILEATAMNTTMKAGAWGVCTRLRNSTGVIGPATWCTSKTSGYELYFVPTVGGVNQFPTVPDDPTLFGTNGDDTKIFILGSGSTRALWLHVITSIVTITTVASLATPPAWFGTPESYLHEIQKSGMLTIFLGFASFILGLVTFIIDLIAILPAKNRLAGIAGITAKIGNIQWYVLPSILLMLPAFASVLMTASKNEFSAL